MKILVKMVKIALFCVIFGGSAALAQSETAPAPKAKAGSGSSETAPAQPAPSLSFADMAGTWTGAVKEQGVEAVYRITLTLLPNGAGEVHYLGAGYDCKGVLAPIRAGDDLEYYETITLRRDQCGDASVYITPQNGEMLWAWGYSRSEIYATATITRSNY